MSETHEPDETIREELVAYLDGELSPEEARAVEERLSRDERYRREMQGLDRAWNALEELPQVSVDDSFTKTTIEMVAVAAEKDLAQQTQALPMIRRKRTLWIAGMIAIAATLGFAIARIVLDRPDRVLLANLPLVQHLDAYSQNLSPEFLVALQTQAGDILEPYRDEELERQLEALQETEAASTVERRAMVEAMTDGEKAALQANYIRFEQLPHERRVQLADFYKELSDGKNSEELQRNMLAYWAWLQDRRDAGPVQADLRQAESIKDRLAMMQRIDRGQNRRIPLSPEEAKKLRGVVMKLANDREFREVTRQLSERFGGPRGENRNRRGSRNWRTVATIGMLRHAARSSVEDSNDPDDPELEALRERARILWERFHAAALAALTPDTRANLERRENPNSELLGLTWKAMQEGTRPSEEDLERYFASGSIDAKRMQELLGMSRERMLEELWRDYRREQIGEDGPGSWRGDRRGSRGDRSDDRDDRRDGRRRGDGHPDDDRDRDRDRGSDDRERRANGPPRGDGPPRNQPPRPGLE